MIIENLSTLKIHKLTQEQYDREIAAGNIDEKALYLTPEEEIDLSGYATVDQLDSKVDIAQGIENAGKILAVDEEGNVSLNSAQNVGDSTINGNIIVNDTEVNVYTHPTTSGNKHIPSGGSSGQILRWSADGTAVWGNDKAIYKKKLITLPTTGWVGDYAPYTINISIDGVLENSDVQITPMLEMTLEQLDAWENLRLYAGKTYDGYITLKANGFKPNVEIPLEVLIGAEIVE